MCIRDRVHGLAGLVGQRAHERRGQSAQIELRELARGQLEQAHRAAIAAAILVAHDVAGVNKRLQGAVGIAARQPDPGGQRIDGAGPVSYTHLDVYKRQLYARLWSHPTGGFVGLD